MLRRAEGATPFVPYAPSQLPEPHNDQAYVLDTCVASPQTQRAVGKIVEIASAPDEAPDASYLPGTYYDVLFEGWTFFCRSDKLRPISDPDAEIAQWEDEFIDLSAQPGLLSNR